MNCNINLWSLNVLYTVQALSYGQCTITCCILQETVDANASYIQMGQVIKEKGLLRKDFCFLCDHFVSIAYIQFSCTFTGKYRAALK